MLGNTKLGDGALFHGRGYVQLTGRSNYERASKKLNNDFVLNPWLVKDPRYAWPIMRTGMAEGWFTGKSLNSYIDDIDESDSEDFREYTNARRIINGTDKATTIAQLAVDFEYALRTSGYSIASRPVIKVQPIAPQIDIAQTFLKWFLGLFRRK